MKHPPLLVLGLPPLLVFRLDQFSIRCNHTNNLRRCWCSGYINSQIRCNHTNNLRRCWCSGYINSQIRCNHTNNLCYLDTRKISGFLSHADHANLADLNADYQSLHFLINLNIALANSPGASCGTLCPIPLRILLS